MLEYCADIPPAWNDCRPHKTHKKMRASGVQLYEYKGELRQETPKKSTTPQRPMQGLPADIRKDRIIPVMLKKNF